MHVHNLMVASERFVATDARDTMERARLAKRITRHAAKAHIEKVLNLWERALGMGRSDISLAIAIGKAAPRLIGMTPYDSPHRVRIYELLKDTLIRAPQKQKAEAAELLGNAYILTSGPVHPVLAKTVRQCQDILQKFPDVWRYIGTVG